MFYTRYNVNAWVRKADKRIDTLHDDEVDDKVELLYSLGYVYNPYYREFTNHFLNRGFKAIAIYNLDEGGILEMHKLFKSETILKYGREKSLLEILTEIDKMRGNNDLISIKLLSSPIGVLLLIMSPIFLYYELHVLCLLSALISTVFINHFVAKNATIATVEGRNNTGTFWQNYEGLFYVLGLGSTLYCYYILYLSTDSFWMPLPILLLIRYLYRRYVAVQVAREYRTVHEYLQVKDYAEINNI